jgi:hypothetical protein
VHQINRPDDKSYGPYAPSLDMEIVYSQCATVRTRLILGKTFFKIGKADRIVVRSDALCLPSERCLGISSKTLI